jgi:hypothetical protein
MFDLISALSKLLNQPQPQAPKVYGARSSKRIGGRMPVLAEKARDKKKTRRLMAKASRRVNRARL